METISRRLLVVDDEPDIARFIADAAVDLGYDVRTAGSAEAFKRLYDAFDPTVVILDVVILDVVMPDVDGIELVQFLAERKCKARVLVISGYAPQYMSYTATLGQALGLPSIRALAKPIDLDALKDFLAGPHQG